MTLTKRHSFFFPTAENVTEKEKEECPFNNAVN